jgi:hypothetical protein
MNKQAHRLTSPLQGDNWKNHLRDFLAQDDASLEAKYHTNDVEPEIEPEPFYFVAPNVEARFDLPTNVLSALDALTQVSDIG